MARICSGTTSLIVVMLLSLQTLAHMRRESLTYPEMATAAEFLKCPGKRGFHVCPKAHKDFQSYLIPYPVGILNLILGSL